MPSSINASTTTGLVSTADLSGILNLQSNGVTVATINSTGIVMASNTAPAFSAYRSTSSQSISASTWTKVQLNTEVFDTNSNFDSTTNYRFTPTVAGYYQFNASILFSFTGTSTVTLVGIYKNGSIYIQNESTATQTNGPTVNTSALISMNGTTDYVEMWGYSGGTAAFFTLNAENTTFSGFLARSA